LTDACDSLILPGFASAEEVAAIKARTQQLLADWDPSTHPLTQFKTEDYQHVGDEYFLASANNISFFMEEAAVDTDQHKLRVPKEQAVNRIGHALVKLDDVFRTFTLSDRVRGIARSLDFQDPRVLQSMVICKQPRIGGPVPPHQDSTFLWTDPNTTIGFWLALEDCTQENGALSFLPGSHKDVPVTRRFIRHLDRVGVAFIGDPAPEFKPDAYVLADCPAGSLVLIHGAVVHASPPNQSDKSRWAYTFHVIDGAAKYSTENWYVTLSVKLQ